MGVHSFWDIVGPTAKPVRLESLQDKKMAVDASIWIYQFLKAVRDQEGNRVPNAHIVGFFRRICKLLYFGIKPVFVFDGGVPVLKRRTIEKRRERRQGKRDSAKNTARKLLAIQLQKNQDNNSRKGSPVKQDKDELYKPHDEWDLPDIPGFRYSLDDQRVTSSKDYLQVMKTLDDELENIDIDSINPASEEFDELPRATQYMILSNLRLRSRLRMGYSKEQLEEVFPDSMDFSKFQIDMLKRRNFYTQKLINTTGSNDTGSAILSTELTHKISGQKQREYKLSKTENGWTLGLGDDDGSELTKAIKIDCEPDDVQPYKKADEFNNGDIKYDNDDADEETADWEDVETEPTATKASNHDYSLKAAKLPVLKNTYRSAGSQSFLDSRPESHSSGRSLSHAPAVVSADTLHQHDSINIFDEYHPAYSNQQYDSTNTINGCEPVDARHGYNSQKLQYDIDEKKQVPNVSTSINITDEESVDSYSEYLEEIEQIEQHQIRKHPKSSISHDDKGDDHISKPSLQSGITAKDTADDVATAITEGQNNMNLIMPKINMNGLSTQDSFLFGTNETNSNLRASPLKSTEFAKDDKSEKSRANKLPSWFADHEMKTTNYPEAGHIDERQSEAKIDSSKDKSYQLATGLEATALIDESRGERNDEEDDIEVLDKYDSNPETNLSKTHDVCLSDKNLIYDPSITKRTDNTSKKKVQLKSSNGLAGRNIPVINSINENDECRRPIAFDYDFSEDEEEILTQNIIKETNDFKTFKVTALGNSSTEASKVDKAFLEDDIYKSQAKNKRDADEVTPDMIQDVQELLTRFGVPYITAPMEAEAQCAELLRLGLVNGIITDDSDVFLFGGDKIYKNMFHEKTFVEFYDGESIRRDLGLTRENFIEIAQLLGSDYTTGIKGMGPVNSLEVLAEFGNLKNFREWYEQGQFNIGKLQDESKFRKDLRKRLVNNEVIFDDNFPSELVFFAYMSPEVDHDTTQFKWGIPDLDILRSFFKTRLGWPQEKSDEVLIPLIRDINKRKSSGQQKSIGEFFSTDQLAGKRLNLSKRLTTAAEKLKKRRIR